MARNFLPPRRLQSQNQCQEFHLVRLGGALSPPVHPFCGLKARRSSPDSLRRSVQTTQVGVVLLVASRRV